MTRFKNLILIVVMALLLCIPSMAFAQERTRPADLGAYTAEMSTEGDVLVITNTHLPETHDLTVGVIWDDDKDRDGIRPDTLTVQLYNGETPVAEKILDLTSDDLDEQLQTWLSEINADKYENHGQEIQYSLKIVTDEPDGYEYLPNTEDPLRPIAKHEVDTVTKSNRVIFDDDNNRDGDRPDEVIVQLLQNGEPYGDPVTVPCNEEEGICYFSAEDLPKNVDGEPAVYTIEIPEDKVPEHYTPSTDPETGDIWLTRDPSTFAKKDISVKKVWEDKLDQDGLRPESICIILKGDTSDYTHTLTGAMDVAEWTYTFTDVNVNRDGGTPIVYTIEENGTTCP